MDNCYITYKPNFKNNEKGYPANWRSGRFTSYMDRNNKFYQRNTGRPTRINKISDPKITLKYFRNLVIILPLHILCEFYPLQTFFYPEELSEN